MQDDTKQMSPERLLRLPQVLKIYPVSKSTWWLGISEGRYPQPVKISHNAVAWLESDIQALIDQLANGRSHFIRESDGNALIIHGVDNETP